MGEVCYEEKTITYGIRDDSHHKGLVEDCR